MGVKLALSAALATLLPLVVGLAAFPGADGFGAVAVGGRSGGSVYIVTNLNDSGAGSLRDAVSVSNRIVVFRVGGIINIDARIVVSPNIYIAGQTAPGQGITVYGNGVSYSNAHNTITRYIRYRMGKGGDSGKDAMGIADGHNMIFDHISTSWGRDETFSINGDVTNVTISNSIIAQGLETHSCGGLMQTSGGVSIFRTLYIDNKTRNPKVKGVNDFTNNVVYNWGGGGGYIAGDSAGPSYANIIGNAFISGPSTTIHPVTRGNENFQAYVAGTSNYYDPDQDGTLNGVYMPDTTEYFSDVIFASTQFDYPPPYKLLNATEAVAYVIANAGASVSRDKVDEYLVTAVPDSACNTELLSYGTVGALISDENTATIGGPGPVTGGTALTDTDNDGIPDEWETANGLNPDDASDSMQIASNGYTNLENYVNSLVPTW
ncbi:pectin lyase-like protein [Auriculariales sp. MPI-PUGE-AT-0066]|nr:pectin lyase-like protein [Auriculariales sp. MPI-PUGE-AT-0066]